MEHQVFQICSCWQIYLLIILWSFPYWCHYKRQFGTPLILTTLVITSSINLWSQERKEYRWILLDCKNYFKNFFKHLPMSLSFCFVTKFSCGEKWILSNQEASKHYWECRLYICYNIINRKISKFATQFAVVTIIKRIKCVYNLIFFYLTYDSITILNFDVIV